MRVALVAAVALASCGAPVFSGKCDNRDRQSLCTDYAGHTVEYEFSSVRASCTGVWWEGQECERAGALGGCRRQNPQGPQYGTITTWYYPSATMTTTEQARAACGFTFLTP